MRQAKATVPNTQAVLWDLDGVLVDTGPFHFAAWQAFMGEQGRDFTQADFQHTFGLRNDAILAYLFGNLSSQEAACLAERKERLFRSRLNGLTALPGAAETVKRLSSTGLKQAVVSSGPRENVELVLSLLGLLPCFAAIVAEQDVRRGKPDPEGFLLAAQRLGVSPGRCVVVEDAPQGVAAGKAAGMRCIGLASSRPPQALVRADLVVSILEDSRVWPMLLGAAER